MTIWIVVAFAGGTLVGAVLMFWWLSSIDMGER